MQISQSSKALWLGIGFSLGFTALVWLLGARLEAIPKLPDTGVAWYYWKLPEPTWYTRLSAWLPYVLHQIAIFYCIYYAQTRVKTYTSGLHAVNVWALGINAFFVLLHLAQTHLFYDGLAQDVSIFSSQGSVIVLLVAVLLIENRRRGMFFGQPIPMRDNVFYAIRKYHGYFFAWAVIYTFWYHPMEDTTGHLWGTFYTLLLMLQGSLFLTRMHLNKYWTLTQEVLVTIHGALVAVQQGNGIWAMFAFGFGGIFIITQMHGLGWSKAVRWGIASVYMALVVWVYSGRGWGKLNEIIRIPVIDYVLVYVLMGLVALLVWIFKFKSQTKT